MKGTPMVMTSIKMVKRPENGKKLKKAKFVTEVMVNESRKATKQIFWLNCMFNQVILTA